MGSQALIQQPTLFPRSEVPVARFRPRWGDEDRIKIGLISLFCGPGGLDTGCIKAFDDNRLCTGKTLYACDIDEKCVATYRHNHPDTFCEIRDLSRRNAPQEVSAILRALLAESEVSVLGVVGGPPCQGMSVGNVTGSDERRRSLNNLTYRYADIINHLHDVHGLGFFLFENVKGKAEYERVFRHLRAKLQGSFHIAEKIVNAAEMGTPQLRRRRIIVGLSRDRFERALDLEGIRARGPRSVSEAWARSPLAKTTGTLPEPVMNAPGLTAHEVKKLVGHSNHLCLVPRSPKFTDGRLKSRTRVGKSFKVLHADEPSLTVAYGHREVHVHPNGHRRISVYEAMLLQGFPHNYELVGTLTDQIRLISEAVPPPVGRALMKRILGTLLEHADAGKKV